jgi:hypothetical protein
MITKKYKRNLYTPPDLFKEPFEAYIEKGFKEYINDIGKHC